VFERILKHREHIPPHRIWAFIKDKELELELTLSEHVHIVTCALCGEVFSACLHAETFGAALRSLEREPEKPAA